MKTSRFLVILLTLAGAALLTGCTKEYYQINEGVEMYQRDFNVKSSDWKAIDATDQWGEPNGGLVLCVELTVPEITKDVVNYGQVTVTRRLEDNGETFWTPLPLSRAEALRYGESDEYFYSTYMDFEWGYQTVYVYFTATDLEIETDDKGKPIGPEVSLRVTVWI